MSPPVLWQVTPENNWVIVTCVFHRSSDLIAHRQLKEYLRTKKPLLSASMVEDFNKRISSIVRIRNKVESDITAYWVAEYFRQRMAKETWKATILIWTKQTRQLARVLIESLGVVMPMRMTTQKVLGTSFPVRVASVDVKGGSVEFEEVEVEDK